MEIRLQKKIICWRKDWIGFFNYQFIISHRYYLQMGEIDKALKFSIDKKYNQKSN